MKAALYSFINRFRAHLFAAAFVLLIVAVAMFGLGASHILVVGVSLLVVYGIIVWKLDRRLGGGRRSESADRKKYVSVAWDDEEIVVSVNGARRESVRWNELLIVGIRIESEGSIDMPYWILGGQEGGCTYPQGANGSAELLQEMQRRLVGFDNEAVVQAMGMLSGGVVVWNATAV